MKKVLSLVLVLAMVLGSFSLVSAAPLNDVAGTVYEDAFARLSLLGILTGYPDGTFKPENQITRAEFAAVAIRAKGLDSTAQASKGLATGFKDVPASHWASGYVGTAAKLGIVNGVGNGQFAPEAPVKYEEAITMLVRALGYEEAAKQKGGYPYGYLIVANENGLLDEVKGTQGAPALRGTVAQLVDNALEIPMMIQVGYGTNTKWVVSGSKEHGDDAEERYLLDEMGFESVKGRVESVSQKTNKLTVKPTDKDKKNVTLKVSEGFDFYAVEGLVTKFWYKNETVVDLKVKDEAKFDAVEYDEKEKELTLITEDENYEVARDAYLELDGEKVKIDKFEADYAKIVLNDDDEIIWAEGYTLDGFLVVDEVKDNVITAYGEDELKVKDFTIVKDGKTIEAEDLEDGEVVFYNNNEDFAVVATISKSGKIDRVYSDSFRFEGKTYKFDNAKYFDGKNLSDFDMDVLDEVVEDEDEVKAIFNFANKVVLISGADKKADASTFYAVLLEDSGITAGRRNQKHLSIDVRTADGSKKAYDLDAEFVKKNELGTIDGNDVKTIKAGIDKEGDVIKITVDKDGEPSKIHIVKDSDKVNKDFKFTATYAKGKDGDYKLTPSTVIFYNNSKKAIKVGDIKDEFEVIKEGGVIFHEAGKAVAIVADTNADKDTKIVYGLLTAVKELSSGAYEFRMKVAGKSEAYVTESTKLNLSKEITGAKNVIAKLEVGEKAEKVVLNDDGKIIVFPNGSEVTVKSVSGRTLTTDKGKYELVDNYKAYDSNDDFAEVRSIRDLVDKKVTLYFDGNSKTYVSYVIVGRTARAEKDKVTHINVEQGLIEVNDEVLELDIKVKLVNAKGETLAIGSKAVAAKLRVGDAVKLTEEKGVVTKIELLDRKEDPVVDKKALEAALEEAKDKEEADYTAESWKAFQNALKAAEALPETTQAEVDAKVAAVNAAIKKLVKKEEEGIKAKAEIVRDMLGVQKVVITVSGAEAKDVEKVLINGNEVEIQRAEGNEVTILSAERTKDVVIVVEGKEYKAELN